MRSAVKGQRIIFVRQFLSQTNELDENGLETGSVIKVYSDWYPVQCLFTAYHGYVNLENQGRTTSNQITISFISRTCPVNMMTDIYIGDDIPDEDTKPNYSVSEIKQSKNCFAVTIKEVEVK